MPLVPDGKMEESPLTPSTIAVAGFPLIRSLFVWRSRPMNIRWEFASSIGTSNACLEPSCRDKIVACSQTKFLQPAACKLERRSCAPAAISSCSQCGPTSISGVRTTAEGISDCSALHWVTMSMVIVRSRDIQADRRCFVMVISFGFRSVY